MIPSSRRTRAVLAAAALAGAWPGAAAAQMALRPTSGGGSFGAGHQATAWRSYFNANPALGGQWGLDLAALENAAVILDMTTLRPDRVAGLQPPEQLSLIQAELRPVAEAVLARGRVSEPLPWATAQSAPAAQGASLTEAEPTLPSGYNPQVARVPASVLARVAPLIAEDQRGRLRSAPSPVLRDVFGPRIEMLLTMSREPFWNAGLSGSARGRPAAAASLSLPRLTVPGVVDDGPTDGSYNWVSRHEEWPLAPVLERLHAIDAATPSRGAGTAEIRFFTSVGNAGPLPSQRLAHERREAILPPLGAAESPAAPRALAPLSLALSPGTRATIGDWRLSAADTMSRLARKARSSTRHTGARWVEQPGMTLPEDGYAIPGGLSLEGVGGEATVYLTERLFSVGRSAVPAGARRVPLRTYRYYHPRSQHRQRNRGSGRDHLIGLDGGGERTLVAVKGSGVNRHFSELNGSFVLEDFRRNGLLSVGDEPDGEHGGGFLEYVTAKNLEAVGVPVVRHENPRLLPASLQTKGLHRGSAQFLALQVDRVLDDARESYYGSKPDLGARLRLSAALYFHNVGHGAINPENVTGDGRIVDMGHVTFGYPLTSGLYRCTVCRGVHGSSMDGSMVGPLDHYFEPPKRTYTRSYTGELRNAEAKRFVQELLRHLNPAPFSSPLAAHEADALRRALKENLKFSDEASLWLPAAQLELLGLAKDGESSRSFTPTREAASLRLLLQVAALDRLLGPASAEMAKNNLLAALTTTSRRDARVLIELFQRLIDEKNVRPKALRRALFREHLPYSEMHHVQLRELKALNGESLDVAAVAAKLRKLLVRFTKPVDVSPFALFMALRKLGSAMP